ncbi:MAG: SLC13/DASS family transporter [Planctomycetes bacterium]|nr:SLC13/DASS family transporter [Planctomycetota bacterium]
MGRGSLVWGLAVAVAVGLASSALPFAPEHKASRGACAVAVTTLTIWCWTTRCLPLAPASLLPLAVLPLLGVSSTKQVAGSYSHPLLWLLFGGFVLALGVERWGLHRRLALHVIAAIGPRPRRLVLGFLLASAALSMWINNTATSLMLLPIGTALIDRIRAARLLDAAACPRLGTALLLGIAYGASVGGLGSPIGTAPNLLFLQRYQECTDRLAAPGFSFLHWLVVVGPIALVLAVAVWACLVWVVFRLPSGDARSGSVIAEELRALPPLGSAERRVLALFGATTLLWITRRDISFGNGTVVSGWASLLGFRGPSADFIADGSVAVLMAIVSFLVPSAGPGSPPLMDWRTARRVSFDILLLLGGGIAVAAALDDSGVCGALATLLQPLVRGVHPLLAVVVAVTLVTFLTEVTSNTATTSLMLPVLAAVALAAGLDPRLLMLPATLAASCAFMLPVATPPNAVVFASGRVSFGEMARAGLWLNLMCIAVLSLATWFVLVPALGIEPRVVPDWWLRK